MADHKIPPGLEGFSRLNPSIWYLEPTTTLSSSKDPDLIFLPAWMGASAKHISKYTAGYKARYPSSRILAITTTAVEAAFSTESANLVRLAPALEVLCSLPPDAKFLVHFFSNGGALVMTMLAKKYAEKMGRPLNMTAVILDSTPGKATYAATIRAFAVGLPKNPIINFIGMILMRLVFVLYKLQFVVRGETELVEGLRLSLKNTDIFNVEAKRCYIYSVADDMVQWQFVEEHAEEAEKLGYKVQTEKFLKSGHCSHLLIDPERYWAIVQNLWSSAA